MEREYEKEDFIWKRLDCKGPVVNHLSRPVRQWMWIDKFYVLTLNPSHHEIM